MIENKIIITTNWDFLIGRTMNRLYKIFCPSESLGVGAIRQQDNIRQRFGAVKLHFPLTNHSIYQEMQ